MANEVRRSHAIWAMVLGIMEILFGLIIIVCSFVLGSKLKANTRLTPYWAGISYIVPGILGAAVGITKNACAMVAFMVLNIMCFVVTAIAGVMIAIVIGLYATVASRISSRCNSFGGRCTCDVNGRIRTFNVDGCDTLQAVTILLWAIVIFAGLCAIVTFTASIIGCTSVCCNQGPQQPVIVQQPVVMAPAQSTGYGQPVVMVPAQGHAQSPGYKQPVVMEAQPRYVQSPGHKQPVVMEPAQGPSQSLGYWQPVDMEGEQKYALSPADKELVAMELEEKSPRYGKPPPAYSFRS